MSNEDLPGYEEATRLGFSLVYHSGDRRGAGYEKQGIHLDVRITTNTQLEATLSCIHRLLLITTQGISFPNSNFKLFEGQISEAKEKLEHE